MALTLTCPICGKRNGYEFRYGGEDKGPRPAEAGLSPKPSPGVVMLTEGRDSSARCACGSPYGAGK